MLQATRIGDLQVAKVLFDFINDEVLPGTGVAQDDFWSGFGDLANRFGPRNKALLDKRDALQAKIDGWHRANPSRPVDLAAYKAFLVEIGYLVPEVRTSRWTRPGSTTRSPALPVRSLSFPS
jgi:malate synthase